MRAVAALLCLASVPSIAGPLDPYVDADAGFSVLFPSPPEKSEHTQWVRGTSTVSHVYTCDLAQVGYLVSWADHPEALATAPELRMKAARDSVVQGSPVLEETSGRLGGFPSRRLTFERDGARLSIQWVLKGTRLFQAMVVRPAGEAHDTAARTFLDSFGLTSAAAATRPPRPPPAPPPPRAARDGGAPGVPRHR